MATATTDKPERDSGGQETISISGPAKAAADALLARADAILTSPKRGHLAAWLLALAVIAYAALALFVTRGSTFMFDDLNWYADADGFRPAEILDPHYGHLIAVTRVIFTSVIGIFGPEEVIIRLMVIAAMAGSSVFLFLNLRRRLDPVIALAPAVLVLLLGSTSEALSINVMPFTQATAFGLAGIWVLEGRGRYRDPLACLLLILSVASLELGLGFAIGVAVTLSARRGRSRLWVPAAPAALFLAWWIWARQFGESFLEAWNVLLVPNFAMDSLAAASASLTGLGHNFTAPADATVQLGWGRVIGAMVIGFLGWNAFREGVNRFWLGMLAVLAFFWLGFGLGSGFLRTPEADRYAYPVAVVLALLVGESARTIRWKASGLLALWVIVACALGANLFQIRENGADIRGNSDLVRADLGVIEIQRDTVDAGFEVGPDFLIPLTAGQYLEAADRHGGLGFSPEEIVMQQDSVRREADATLIEIVRPTLAAADIPRGRSCETIEAHVARAGLLLAPGGAAIRVGADAEVGLRRFGDESQAIGEIPRGTSSELLLPVDSSTQPWVAIIATDEPVAVCALSV